MRSSVPAPSDGIGDPNSTMAVEEALQVSWLSYKPRPLGELMEEGSLDTSRLEWAAQKAYNPILKKAAAVLLSEKEDLGQLESVASGKEVPEQTARNVGISLAEAAATRWPFRDHKGEAMGPLVRTGTLSLKDLAYAIENAWDDQVRRAAIRLSLLRLDQEIEEGPPAAGPLNVVLASKRSYAQRRQLQIATIEGAMIGGLTCVEPGIPCQLISGSVGSNHLKADTHRGSRFPLAYPSAHDCRRGRDRDRAARDLRD